MFGRSSRKFFSSGHDTLFILLSTVTFSASRGTGLYFDGLYFFNVRMIFIYSRLLCNYINVMGTGVILFYYFHPPVLKCEKGFFVYPQSQNPTTISSYFFRLTSKYSLMHLHVGTTSNTLTHWDRFIQSLTITGYLP